MAKCLTTQLPEAVTDTSLPLAGEAVLQTAYVSGDTQAENHAFTIISSVPQTLTITDVEAGTGAFTDATLAADYGTSLAAFAQQQTVFYLSNGTYKVHIPNKSAIRWFFAPKTSKSYHFFDLDMSLLDGMPLLEQVSAAKNASGSIESLGGAAALTLVNVSEGSLQGDIGALDACTSLQGITINYSSVTGDIAVAASWTNLLTFNAQGGLVSGDVSAFAGLANLTTLNVDQCQGVTGNISSLASCTNMGTLSLGGTQVAGNLSSLSGMTDLLALYWLRTAGTPSSVTGDLSSLAACTRLTSLSLPAYSAITSDASTITALSGMTNMTSITLSNITGLAGDIASACSGMESLNRLYIENCGSLTGSLSSFSGCTRLSYLVAPNTGLSGDLSGLSGLTSLNTLNLRGCTGVTSLSTPSDPSSTPALSALSGLTALETLDLGFTQAGGNISALSGCTALKWFYAFGLNGLTGSAAALPPQFALLQNAYANCTLSWSSSTARPASSSRFSIQGVRFGTDLSNMLINMAACTPNPYDAVKTISVWGTRTGDDSAAVQTLLSAGYTLTIGGVAVYQ